MAFSRWGPSPDATKWPAGAAVAADARSHVLPGPSFRPRLPERSVSGATVLQQDAKSVLGRFYTEPRTIASVAPASSRSSRIGIAARPSCGHSASGAERTSYGTSMVERSHSSARLCTRFTSSSRSRIRIRCATWSRSGSILRLDACRMRQPSETAGFRLVYRPTEADEDEGLSTFGELSGLHPPNEHWRVAEDHGPGDKGRAALCEPDPRAVRQSGCDQDRSMNAIQTRGARRSSSATAGRRPRGWRGISRARWSAILFVRRSSLRSRNLPTSERSRSRRDTLCGVCAGLRAPSPALL